MSKEIAQTVGGKRIAWLIAIVAAFAVFATLGSQWRTSNAALPTTSIVMTASTSTTAGATVTYTATATFTPSGSVAAGAGTFVWDFDDDLVFVSASGTGFGNALLPGLDCPAAAPPTTIGAGNVLTCDNFVGSNWASGTIVVTFTNPAAGTISAPSACVLTDTQVATCTGSIAAYDVVGTSGTASAVAAGQAATVTFTLPTGITYCSDGTGGDARAFLASDQTVSGLTVQTTTPTTAVDTGAGTHTVTVVDDAVVGGTVTLSTHLAGAAAGVGCTPTVVTLTAANFILAELRHNDGTPIPARDVSSNVRGSRHTVCVHPANTVVDSNGDYDLNDPGDVGPQSLQLPGLTGANIIITHGGGYASTADTDPTLTDLRIFIGDGSSSFADVTPSVNMGYINSTCFSWVSLDAGDQSISLVYVGANGLNYTVHWDTDGDGNDGDADLNDGLLNTSLVKEWNRLEDSTITVGGTSATGNSTSPLITKNIPVVLNPATGLYQFSSIAISDVFNGSHTNNAGVKESGPLAGVIWTASLSGCGALSGTLGPVQTYLTQTAHEYAGVGGNPSVTFSAGAGSANCMPGDTARVIIRGSEPSPLGSGVGTTVTQIAEFTFSQSIAEKQVFLAWAGQRVILEHDWRLPAGDVDGGGSSSPSPVGECAFDGTVVVTYLKGSGPGNFLPGQGVNVNGSDEADVLMDATDDSQTDGEDIVGAMNGMCISRVLYESEDQGQVDIEAFVDERTLQLERLNYTKVAFVIYYMKINTINVSLVTQVSKPSHNSSAIADYSPGNPWDASKDDADNAADWNVSKDLLVRGRVTGWFKNSNPSGRAADTSNPLNVLPADRWVMPQDWPLLAGGPADPADGSDAVGTAEQFRPYYDIMFAPNNTRNIYLQNPEGTTAIQVTTVVTVTGVTNSASAFRVASCADLAGLPAGADLWVGSDTTVDFASCVGGLLRVTNLASTPAAGTGVFIVSGAPFEGPYSTLDIKGLAAQGLGGAALSDWDPNNIRDTMLGDGDVDWWDAPMPAAPVSVSIRGTGFIKQVLKHDVYYLGSASSTDSEAAQLFPNPYYIQDIPASPFIPAVVAGGGYFWNTWGNDGPGGNGDGVYRFWEPAIVGTNSEGFGDSTVTSAQATELAAIRAAYGDDTIARDLVVYTDNHGEFMVTANGDFKTDLTACATNVLAGGKHCKPGDKVGTGTITATVDYPDFRGKHFPVLSNAATVTWLWGGYKDVTVENGETDQFKYIVFHAMDRDGFCAATGSQVLLHPVLSGAANDTFNGNQAETVDFLIDSGEGIILGTSGATGSINDGKQFATGVKTFSVLLNDPATSGILEFPLSSLAASGQTDECQAWIKVSNSLLGILNVLAIAHDDEGNIGFDEIIDLTNTTSYTLNFRWSLITWAGADDISVSDAIKGTGTSGKNPGGNDISASVTAIYGWDASAQDWLGYFPSGVNVPGANDLTVLKTGQAYWIAITGPSSVTWTIASNVN